MKWCIKRNKYLKRCFIKSNRKNLLNKIQTEKNVSNIDKDLFREMKNEKLRREKESLTIERNDIKLTTMRNNDKEKIQIKFYLQENERIKNLVE